MSTEYQFGSQEATVSQHGSSPPVLGPGEISVAALLRYDRLCRRYFAAKSVSTVDQVQKVIHYFDHEAVITWTNQNYETLIALTFDDFMKALRKKFLPQDWPVPLAREMRQHQNGKPFEEWVSAVRTACGRLEGSPEKKDDSWLWDHLRSTMDHELRIRYDNFRIHEDLDLITDLDKWYAKVLPIAKNLEDERRSRNASWVRGMEAAGNVNNQQVAPRQFTPGSAASTNTSLISRVGPRAPFPSSASSRAVSFPSRTVSFPSNSSSSQFPSNSQLSSNLPRVYPVSSFPNTSRPYPPLSALYETLPPNVARPPALTEAARRFLIEHKGCFRCRSVYADHNSADCDMVRNIKPENWTRSWSVAELAALYQRWLIYRPKPAGNRVAAVSYQPDIVTASIEELEAEFSAAQVSDFIDGSTEASLPDGVNPDNDVSANAVWTSDSATTFVGATMYDDDSTPSCVLEEEPDDMYVLPASTPPPRAHLLWGCLVDGPASPPARTHALIDHGCPTVLISSKLADGLGLRKFNLAKPVAMGGVGGGTFSCNDYVKLHVRSLDNIWTARTTRALVVPNLHFDLILGLEWLSANKIIVDMAECSVTSKESGYVLIDPASVPPPKFPSYIPSPSATTTRLNKKNAPATTAKRFRDDMKTLLKETMKKICVEIGNTVTRIASVESDVLSFSMLRNRIASLAAAVTRQQCFATADAQLKAEFNDLFLDSKSSSLPSVTPSPDLDALLRKADGEVKSEFKDLFPDTLPPVDSIPSDVRHRIIVTAAEKICVAREYSCPRKWRDAWKTLIEEHTKAGRIRPSSSPFASPSFLIAKADPSAAPRWVIDYRRLNSVTVPDRFPLPRIDDILADCAKGKIWAKIDMTNAFFQTRMHPDDIPFTACRTPFGLYEWTVMPMGLRNSPSTQQRRVTSALRHLIGKICHVYLDDIIIWSSSLDEHFRNVRLVLEALRANSLLCSMKKSVLFCEEVIFLGHRISRNGVEADPAKISKILDWPVPRSATEVRRFLGLVKFVAHFLPDLARHTHRLYPLTTKPAEKSFPTWSPVHQEAFEAIKHLVTSRRCLTTINHDNPGNNKVFVTCDASITGTGAVLSWGPSWKESRPVAFDSQQYSGAERHYPTHEQELLAIIRALRKWRSDLIGMHFEIFTDHKTLLNFDTQRDLSRRQARWMEFLSQYDYKISYVAGVLNCAADALSRVTHEEASSVDNPMMAAATFLSDSTSVQTPSHPPTLSSSSLSIGAVLKLSSENTILDEIKQGYTSDPFIAKVRSVIMKGSASNLHLSERDGLFFYKDRIIIPNSTSLRERLFYLAHDQLGHFGVDKSYETLRASFYWPNMRMDLEKAYVPACETCQMNKSSTSRPSGPLHPLPIPDQRFSSIAIDFVGPLPEDEGYDYLATITDRLGADVKLIPCKTTLTAEEFAKLFIDHWVSDNGCPSEIVSDRDRRFLSKFWSAFLRHLDIKHLASTAYHPQTDGASERTNKTVVQALRFFVDRNQKGWVQALPRVRFNIMNSVNASSKLSGFQLKSGFSPRLIPASAKLPLNCKDGALQSTDDLIKLIHKQTMEAQDNLLAAKIVQAHYANEYRDDDPRYKVGDKVWLNTANRRRDYVLKGSGRVAKFMPRYDGPFEIIKAHPESSSYTLALPPSARIHPSFHVSQLKRFIPNDDTSFPSRKHENPKPVLTLDGEYEHVVEKIIDERNQGRGKQYLVRWKGFSATDDEWLPGRMLKDNAALDVWEKRPLLSEGG